MANLKSNLEQLRHSNVAQHDTQSRKQTHLITQKLLDTRRSKHRTRSQKCNAEKTYKCSRRLRRSKKQSLCKHANQDLYIHGWEVALRHAKQPPPDPQHAGTSARRSKVRSEWEVKENVESAYLERGADT